jgi:hypothetical protein
MRIKTCLLSVVAICAYASGTYAHAGLDRTVAFTNGKADVCLAVTSSVDGTAYAVEEQLPDGCSPTGISSDGVWNAAQRKIKCGPYIDRSPRL